MLLSEIITEIMERSAGTLPEGSIIRKLNQLQGQLFRKYITDTTVTTLDLEANNGMYPLPCPKKNIVDVLVQGESVPYDVMNGRAYSKFYFTSGDYLGIYPVPTEDVIEGLTVFHYVSPAELSSNDTDGEPDLDSDFHMLLVYGVLIDVADPGERAEYKAKYDDLLSDFVIAQQGPEPDRIKEVPWG